MKPGSTGPTSFVEVLRAGLPSLSFCLVRPDKGSGAGNPATAHMTTGQKIASAIPGTDANREKKAYEGRY